MFGLIQSFDIFGEVKVNVLVLNEPGWAILEQVAGGRQGRLTLKLMLEVVRWLNSELGHPIAPEQLRMNF